ncbi:hypothetical protein OIU76_009964 [Salix suchowensis]|nr:hypothetical protein OIU76_009964 [Salix suchowensis]
MKEAQFKSFHVVDIISLDKNRNILLRSCFNNSKTPQTRLSELMVSSLRATQVKSWI